MMKKFSLVILSIIVVVLVVFCGCSVDEGQNSQATTASQSSTDVTVTSAVDNKEATEATQYIPEHTDENELEIMTVPNIPVKQESTPSQSTTEASTADGGDFIQSETKIELPFVPVQ